MKTYEIDSLLFLTISLQEKNFGYLINEKNGYTDNDRQECHINL